MAFTCSGGGRDEGGSPSLSLSPPLQWEIATGLVSGKPSMAASLTPACIGPRMNEAPTQSDKTSETARQRGSAQVRAKKWSCKKDG